MEERVYNFSAGPACLPMDVLKQAQKDFISYGGSGMNVMEMSHRSPEYQNIIDTASGLKKRSPKPKNSAK